MIIEELEDAGFDVEGSPDGEKALEILKSGARFDLLFTDIRMPGSVDGWELGRNAQDLLPGMPIVYVTGYSEKAHCLQENEGFLAKPYRTRDVLELIGGFGITT
jgi:CheY-like chemotaxis protein